MATTPTMPGAGPAELEYRAGGMAQLRILRQQMDLGGLKIGSRRVYLGNGVTCFCSICFNIEEVYVSVPTPADVVIRLYIALTEFTPQRDINGAVIYDSDGEVVTDMPEYEIKRQSELSALEFTAPLSDYYFYRSKYNIGQYQVASGLRSISVDDQRVYPTSLRPGRQNWQDGLGGFLTWDWNGDRYFWGAYSTSLYTEEGEQIDAPYWVRGCARLLDVGIIASISDGSFRLYATTAESPDVPVWTEIKQANGSALHILPTETLPFFFTTDATTACCYFDDFYNPAHANYLTTHGGDVHAVTFTVVEGVLTASVVVTACPATDGYVGPAAVYLDEPPQTAPPKYDYPGVMDQEYAFAGHRELIAIDATDVLKKLYYNDGVRVNCVRGVGNKFDLGNGVWVWTNIYSSQEWVWRTGYYMGTTPYQYPDYTGVKDKPVSEGRFYECDGVFAQVDAVSKVSNTTLNPTTDPPDSLESYFNTAPDTWERVTTFDLRRVNPFVSKLAFSNGDSALVNGKMYVNEVLVKDLGTVNTYDEGVNLQFKNRNLAERNTLTNDPNINMAYVYSVDGLNDHVFLSWRYDLDKVLTYYSSLLTDESGDGSLYFKSMESDKTYFESKKQYFYTGLARIEETI